MLLIAPFCIGLLFSFILPEEKKRPGIIYLLGFMVYLGIFEVIAICTMTMVRYHAFSYCVNIFTPIAAVMALAGAFVGVKNYRNRMKGFRLPDSLETRIYWGIFFVLVLFQMVMAVVMASFDGDDSYYVVESLLAQQADVMNTILPYTGGSTSIDIRHSLAVITMFIAYVARMSGIHATIVSHVVMPLFFIPLVYLVYVEIGKTLFRKRQDMVPVFMLVVSFLLLFGNVSQYTPATFFLMRTWQGKALVANVVFPLILWVFLWMYEEAGSELSIKSRIAPWFLLTFVNMFSGMCTSLGVFFGSGLIALFTLVLLFLSKRWTVIIGAFCSVIPNLIYLGIYLFIGGA